MKKILQTAYGDIPTLLHDPVGAAIFLNVVTGTAILSMIPTSHWSRPSLTFFIVGASVAFTVAIAQLIAKRHVRRWMLHANTIFVISLTTVLAEIGKMGDTDFACLYILIILYASLVFSTKITSIYFATCGVAYFLILTFGKPTDNPVAAWAEIIGTAFVANAVVNGLLREVRRAALEDSLTGLPNHRAWQMRLREEMERSDSTSAPLSMAFIDIDKLKVVNDQLGHEAGDQLLQSLGEAWRASIRSRRSDLLARIGGDEFALIAPGSDAEGIKLVVERLRGHLPFNLTISVGTATWDGSESMGSLTRRADKEMYRAKEDRQGQTQPRLKEAQKARSDSNRAMRVDGRP